MPSAVEGTLIGTKMQGPAYRQGLNHDRFAICCSCFIRQPASCRMSHASCRTSHALQSGSQRTRSMVMAVGDSFLSLSSGLILRMSLM